MAERIWVKDETGEPVTVAPTEGGSTILKGKQADEYLEAWRAKNRAAGNNKARVPGADKG